MFALPLLYTFTSVEFLAKLNFVLYVRKVSKWSGERVRT